MEWGQQQIGISARLTPATRVATRPILNFDMGKNMAEHKDYIMDKLVALVLNVPTIMNVRAAFALSVLLTCWFTRPAPAQPPQSEVQRYGTETNMLYRSGGELTPYMRERCRLDVYHPLNTNGFATVVWFHGGGLTGGSRDVPKELQGKGIAVVAVNYRLSPKVKAPAYLEDAAAAVAWTFRHIAEYGGATNRIFVSGHSAGGYLASMIGLDQRWLAAEGLDANAIAGLVPFSGQCITHFTVRAERGISNKQPIIDDFAPLYHVRKDAPPLLLITGGRNSELLGRYEENAYLWRMMKEVGHPDTELCELDGFDHGQMPEPAYPLLLRFVHRVKPKR
jgi:acetyl esterase/lipase